jgi:hypothetical protein
MLLENSHQSKRSIILGKGGNERKYTGIMKRKKRVKDNVMHQTISRYTSGAFYLVIISTERYIMYLPCVLQSFPVTGHYNKKMKSF